MRNISHKRKSGSKQPVVKQPRLQQKERTRQALLAAARELVAGGETPAIARVAEHAGVSLATAYRYYSDPLLLLSDAFSDEWPELPGIVERLGAIRDAAARARAAAETMARHVLAHEPLVRTVLRLANAATEAGKGFRFLLIDRVLEVAPGDARALRRLRLGLAAIVSAEAVLALKDTRECDDDELVATLGWAAARLVDPKR